MKYIVFYGLISFLGFTFLVLGEGEDEEQVEPVKASEGKYQSLIDRNPFLQKIMTQKPLKPANKSNYRFTGYVIRDNKVLVTIEDPTKNKFDRLTLGEKGKENSEIQVKEIHIEGRDKKVTLLVNGEPQVLNIDKLAAPPQGMPMRPPAMGMPGAMGGNSGVISPVLPNMGAGASMPANTPTNRPSIVKKPIVKIPSRVQGQAGGEK